jgi:uncharacterized protein YkwD
VALLNKERAEARLSPLKDDPRLGAVAERVATVSARAESLDAGARRGPDLLGAVKQSGYRYRRLAELAASGQPGPAEVVGSWMKNDADRKNVLGNFAHVGVGLAATAEGRPFWCLILASPLAR